MLAEGADAVEAAETYLLGLDPEQAAAAEVAVGEAVAPLMEATAG